MGDRYEGFEAFVSARGPALMRTASLLTGDRGLAEDALQEALTKVAMKWPKVRAGGAPEPYVSQAIYTVVVDRWRWRSRRVPEQLGDVPEPPSSSDPTSDADRRRRPQPNLIMEMMGSKPVELADHVQDQLGEWGARVCTRGRRVLIIELALATGE